MSKAQIVEALYEKFSKTMRVAMPALIEEYDFETQKASVKIDIKELFQNGNSQEYPVISEVPVIFPMSGGASFTMPVVRGDTCMLIFADRDIEKWLLGARNEPVNSRRAHHLSDAIAIMGLKSFNVRSKVVNNTDVLLSYEGSEIILKPEGKVEINSASEVNCNTQVMNINCKNANIKSEESTNVECKNSSITASELASINGNLKVTGDVEITGTTLIEDKLTTNNGIENSGGNLVSGGITYENHTHQYQDLQEAVNEAGPCALVKAPTNSGGPQ